MTYKQKFFGSFSQKSFSPALGGPPSMKLLALRLRCYCEGVGGTEVDRSMVLVSP
jgi:hypothetical protein